MHTPKYHRPENSVIIRTQRNNSTSKLLPCIKPTVEERPRSPKKSIKQQLASANKPLPIPDKELPSISQNSSERMVNNILKNLAHKSQS